MSSKNISCWLTPICLSILPNLHYHHMSPSWGLLIVCLLPSSSLLEMRDSPMPTKTSPLTFRINSMEYWGVLVAICQFHQREWARRIFLLISLVLQPLPPTFVFRFFFFVPQLYVLHIVSFDFPSMFRDGGETSHGKHVEYFGKSQDETFFFIFLMGRLFPPSFRRRRDILLNWILEICNNLQEKIHLIKSENGSSPSWNEGSPPSCQFFGGWARCGGRCWEWPHVYLFWVVLQFGLDSLGQAWFELLTLYSWTVPFKTTR